MNIRSDIREKINDLYLSLDKKKLMDTQVKLTERYKTTMGDSKSKILSKDDGILYAISRMPATYAVISNLLEQLVSEGKIRNILSVFDIGSGTGAGYLAVSEIFENSDICLFERDKNMIDVFKKLFDKDVKQCDFLNENIKDKADLVVCSYVLSEMTENDQNSALSKLMEISEKYVLLIDTGTPDVYKNYMKIKQKAIASGWKVLAPCTCDKCDMGDDYCQFYTRVERSNLMKMAKSAQLSYEDEKYFYLLLSRDCVDLESERRVIRRPEYKTNMVNLVVCDSGKKELTIAKSDKQLYKKARKIKINEII